MIGRQFGHYTITGELGRGGMGEVYRARDARLEREVALKFLAAASPEALERHRREARLLAALSHPNIATIHGLEEHADQPFLVLELVEGRSLEQELAHGPLSLDRAIAIGHQVAEALAASHARGILHRDLKPGNIHVRPDGLVKVLDFGLGKLQQPTDDDGTTLELGLTRAGAVQGTPEYMSPEQLRGERVDVAADLWGLGCVLYQLLTGQRPFRADQPLALYAAILERPVDLSALPAATPPPLRELVARCLEKRAANRLRDAADAAHRLSTLEGRAPAPAAVPRLVQLSHSDALEESPAWAPDGQHLAYSRLVGAVRKIFVQPADGGPARQLTHGEHDDLQPAFTPDGKALLFVRARVAGTKLEPGDAFGGYDDGDVWRLDLASGEERLLVRDAFNPCPHPTDGSIAVDATWAGSCRLWLVDDRGRNPRQLSSDSSEATWHLRPRWSPDGRFLVFQYVERTVYELRVLDPATGAMHATHDDLIADLQPCFSHDGRHIHFTSAYRSGGLNLWRVPVDDQARATGPLEQVTTGAGQDINVAIGPQGQLAYTTIRQNADLWRLPVDPATGAATGAPEKVLGSSREDSRGAWSPDGRRVAFNSDRMGSMHLWLLELDDGSLRQLTRGVGGDYQPRWSPDATRLVFFSSRQGNPGIWVLDLAEGSEPRCLSPDGQIEVNPLFSPDGEHIYYQSDRDGRMELWRMRSDGRDPQQLTRMGVGGHFLALDGSGRRVIFKQIDGPVMWMPLDGGEAEPLPTVRGGHHLSVAPDGGHIMDVEGHKQLWVSPLPAGEPRKVFRFEHPDDRIDYPLWSPDGKWILLDRFRPEGGDIWVREAPG